VSTRDFEANPNMIWDYDVMMQGTWDGNGQNILSNASVPVIEKYIQAGKGILTGHDTLGAETGTDKGLGKLREYFKIKIRKLWNSCK